MGAYAVTSLILSGLSALLALAVVAVYWRNHRTISSSFTLALLLFATFTLLHSGMTTYQILVIMPMLTGPLGLVQMIEMSLQVSALAALAWAAMR